MAELTIAQLTELLAANVDNADLLPIWDDTASETKKITISNFRTAVGVSNWSESFSSTTQATSQWIPNNAATNINAAIVPKGTGAIVAAIPDGTIVGGNARGAYSVDFQMQRTASNQVASGSYAGIGSGQSNTASASHSVVGGGQNNTASSGQYNVIVGGSFNTCSGGNANNFIGGGTTNSVTGATQDAVCVGGRNNGVSGSYAFIAAGRNNSASGDSAMLLSKYSTASGSFSSILGGQENTASGAYSSVIASYQGQAELHSQIVHSAGQFSTRGDAQAHELVWRRAVTGTAITELFLDGASVAAILPSTNSVWHGIIDITSICSVAGSGTTVLGDVAATSYKVTIKRIGTNTTIVGIVQQIGTLNADTSMSTAVFTINNNDTNESLRLQFTPPTTAAANTVIRVVATFRGTQIKY